MMTLPACASIVMICAEAGALNSSDSIYSLSNVAMLAHKEDTFVWVMQLMYDNVAQRGIHNDQFAFRNRTPVGKSLVDLLVV